MPPIAVRKKVETRSYLSLKLVIVVCWSLDIIKGRAAELSFTDGKGWTAPSVKAEYLDEQMDGRVNDIVSQRVACNWLKQWECWCPGLLLARKNVTSTPEVQRCVHVLPLYPSLMLEWGNIASTHGVQTPMTVVWLFYVRQRTLFKVVSVRRLFRQTNDRRSTRRTCWPTWPQYVHI